MPVLIKNMTMPNNCYECRFFKAMSKPSYAVCSAIPELITVDRVRLYTAFRLYNCPLKEVTFDSGNNSR